MARASSNFLGSIARRALVLCALGLLSIGAAPALADGVDVTGTVTGVAAAVPAAAAALPAAGASAPAPAQQAAQTVTRAAHPAIETARSAPALPKVSAPAPPVRPRSRQTGAGPVATSPSGSAGESAAALGSKVSRTVNTVAQPRYGKRGTGSRRPSGGSGLVGPDGPLGAQLAGVVDSGQPLVSALAPLLAPVEPLLRQATPLLGAVGLTLGRDIFGSRSPAPASGVGGPQPAHAPGFGGHAPRMPGVARIPTSSALPPAAPRTPLPASPGAAGHSGAGLSVNEPAARPDGAPWRAPRELPPQSSGGAAAGAFGGFFFSPFLALLVLLALAMPRLLRRFEAVPAFLRPTPFTCALERPG